MWSIALILSLLPLASAHDYRILHRIHDPLASTPAPFSLRGQLSLTSGPSLAGSDSLGADLLEFAENSQDSDETFYQVALEREGDVHEGQWAVSSVKAVSCCCSPSLTRLVVTSVCT